MKTPWIESVTSWTKPLLRTLGATGLTGLALGLIALALTLGGMLPMRAEVLALRRTAQQTPSADFSAIVAAPESSTTDRLLQSLPDAQGIGPVLIAFAREAQRNHLAFTTAEYRWTPSTATHFGEYEIQFDATGSYLAVRQFCAGVLNNQPAMSLRQLALSRENTGDTVLKARMRWVILVRDGGQR